MIHVARFSMRRAVSAFAFGSILALGSVGVASAGQIDGVITDYESGNQGTDLFIKTADGKSHDLWFDNMRKPSFDGAQLPYCPDFPCTGWPKQLVLKQTHVRVFTMTAHVDGKTIAEPTKVVLLH